ncbi:unnamed protein product [Menidia menidia]|uniref:(Atlantic silverside) hypothetical protein n=1 Tax=Menidia menidia TaxID=238744 RepID=A0A8S4BUG1_9TELE|nr:unnamed protein product [Menidia menidia]
MEGDFRRHGFWGVLSSGRAQEDAGAALTSPSPPPLRGLNLCPAVSPAPPGPPVSGLMLPLR